MLLVLSQVLLEDGESPHVLGPGVVSLPELLSEPGELELVMVQVDGGGEGHGDQGGDYEGEKIVLCDVCLDMEQSQPTCAKKCHNKNIC